MKDQTRDAQYTMGRSETETRRLIEQSQLYDGVTRRFLNAAGIEKGMKVLDIGSGAGDVALTLAEIVGNDGSVVGVDVNAEILETARSRAETAGVTNVEFIAGDARTLDLPDDFDAIVGRLVLMYMAEPGDALRQLATRLRPGGIVAFQEIELTFYRALAHPDTPLVNKLTAGAIAVFEQSGAHIGMGLHLYRAFVDAGLPEPTLHFETPMGGPAAWPGYEFLANSIRSILPLMEAYGIATAEEVEVDTLAERLRAEVVAAKRPLLLPPHITAYATRPE